MALAIHFFSTPQYADFYLKPSAMGTLTKHKLEVGARLQIVIDKSGLTNEAWARKYGRKKQGVNEWLKGRSYPDIEVMIAVCENELLTLDWIFRGVEAGVSKSWAAYLSEPKPASQAVFQGATSRAREKAD